MPYSGKTSEFALFQQYLIGRWVNKTIGKDTAGKNVGGEDNPLSYNIMPLPQISKQPHEPDYPGYILKNFRYYETVKFNNPHDVTTPTRAPNRGGRYTQNARALFYEQQVKFAEGPGKDSVVHVENGAWLYLRRDPQQIGPYDQGDPEPGVITRQPPELTLGKQIAVPHGNSVLALGNFDTSPVNGSPVIADAPPPYPQPDYLSVEPYTKKRASDDNFQNPDPGTTEQPNKPLQIALDILNPNSYIHWHVTTKPLGNDEHGVVTNIPFEQRLAKVTDYFADYWLLSTDNGHNFNYLAYTQTMLMDMIINGQKYACPHITCNIVTKD